VAKASLALRRKDGYKNIKEKVEKRSFSLRDHFSVKERSELRNAGLRSGSGTNFGRGVSPS